MIKAACPSCRAVGKKAQKSRLAAEDFYRIDIDILPDSRYNKVKRDEETPVRNVFYETFLRRILIWYTKK